MINYKESGCNRVSLYLDYSPPGDGEFDMKRYSSEGNDSNELAPMLSEQERQEDFQRHKEELKKKSRRKKRASSSLQSSTFQGKCLKKCNKCCGRM